MTSVAGLWGRQWLHGCKCWEPNSAELSFPALEDSIMMTSLRCNLLMTFLSRIEKLSPTALFHLLKHEIAFLEIRSRQVIPLTVVMFLHYSVLVLFVSLFTKKWQKKPSHRQRLRVAPWSVRCPPSQISGWTAFGRRRKALSEFIDPVTKATKLLVCAAFIISTVCFVHKQ